MTPGPCGARISSAGAVLSSGQRRETRDHLRSTAPRAAGPAPLHIRLVAGDLAQAGAAGPHATARRARLAGADDRHRRADDTRGGLVPAPAVAARDGPIA